MLIVKTFKYDGSVKIRCHYCGESFIKEFINELPRVHFNIPEVIKCKHCKTRERTKKIPYMLGVKKLKLEDYIIDDGVGFTGCGTAHYVPDNPEHDGSSRIAMGGFRNHGRTHLTY